MNSGINIKFNSGPFNTIQLSIYNIVGRIIWSEIVSTQEDQIIQKTWTGKNEHDDPMPSGQYYVQIRSGDQAKTQKIIYLK
ncbi:MAG: T9SS type A sorting domain-containing protein [Candidatus Marinimicrobia bacterium]|nr:T9SS type A sorting domain-containing protein [Candidatus Neomarinimicrobiota bacterium]